MTLCAACNTPGCDGLHAFVKGDRVLLSAMALSRRIGKGRATRGGSVVSLPRGSVVQVTWDGIQTPQGYHRNYLVKVVAIATNDPDLPSV